MTATRKRLTAGALLVGSLSLAACGTTVPVTRTVEGAQPGAGSGFGDPAGLTPGTGGTSPGSVPLPGATRSGAAGGSRPGATASTSAGALPTGTSRAPLASGDTGRGVTAKTITIGAAIVTGSEAAASALGISGAGSVPERAIWDAVVADVNRHGGVLGRKLVLYAHSVDLGSYVANPERTYAQACSDFRDDHKVFAAFISVASSSLRTCLARMGSPLVVYGGSSATVVPAAAYAEHGGSYLYAPSAITAERLAQLFIASLMERRFTAPWDTVNGRPGVAPVKLGLIHADTPDQNHLYAAYTRELAKHGVRFSDTFTYSGSASDALAATQAAVLKFSSEGITHVFGASAFFLRYAESQRYRPRYAYLPGLGALGAENSPPEQMAGSLTVGWAPAQDVNASEDPGDTPAAAACRNVMRAAGLVQGNRQDLKLEYAVCDAVHAFRDALTAGRVPSVAGLRQGYEALGGGFRPALTFATRLGPQRHSGVDAVRDMAFDSGCACLTYTARTNRS